MLRTVTLNDRLPEHVLKWCREKWKGFDEKPAITLPRKAAEPKSEKPKP
jgi:hypothetical protein